MRKVNGVAVSATNTNTKPQSSTPARKPAASSKPADPAPSGKTPSKPVSSSKPAASSNSSKPNPLKIIEDYVKKYLDDYAKKDAVFAAKYRSGKKTVHGAVLYIIQEEYKNCVDVKVPGVPKCKFAGNTDDVHYGWAVHYFDEDSIKEVTELPAEAKQAMKMKACSSNSTPDPDEDETYDEDEQTEEESQPKRKPTTSRKPSTSSRKPSAPASDSFDFDLF